MLKLLLKKFFMKSRLKKVDPRQVIAIKGRAKEKLGLRLQKIMIKNPKTPNKGI